MSNDTDLDNLPGFRRGVLHAAKARLRPVKDRFRMDRTRGYSVMQDILYAEYVVIPYDNGNALPEPHHYVTDSLADAEGFGKWYLQLGCSHRARIARARERDKELASKAQP